MIVEKRKRCGRRGNMVKEEHNKKKRGRLPVIGIEEAYRG